VSLRSAVVCVIAALVFAVSGVARAQGPSAADRDTARHLLDVGHKKFEAKDFAGALESYRGADAIMGVPTTTLGVARALIELGRWVEGRDALLRIERMPVTSNETPAFQRARERARELAADLDARIPTIQARIDGGANARVWIDDHELVGTSATLPRRVDPGLHRVVVRAPGHAEHVESVPVAEREARVVAIALKPVALVTPPPDKARITPVPNADRGVPAWAWAGFGIGGAALVASAVTGGLAVARNRELDSRCPSSMCKPEDRPTYDELIRFANAANVTLAIGVVGVGIGVVGVLLPRKRR
jgi:hypothetical protein